MNEFVKTIVTLLLGIAGPILCYIAVYGSASLIRRIYLLIKARKFKQRMDIARANMETDDFDDIEVEVVTSYDKNNETEEQS